MSNEDIRCFVRPGMKASDPMFGYVKLAGVDCVLLLQADHTVTLHKRLKEGNPGQKSLMAGRIRKNESDVDKAPDGVGRLQGEKMAYKLSVWQHVQDKDDPYLVVRFSDIPVRHGEFFSL